jgi:hypothetical protein
MAGCLLGDLVMTCTLKRADYIRLVFNTILFINTIGCQWANAPEGSGQAVHRFRLFSTPWKKGRHLAKAHGRSASPSPHGGWSGPELTNQIGFVNSTFQRSSRRDGPKMRSSASRRQLCRADGSHLSRITAPCQQLMRSAARRSGGSPASICPCTWANEMRAATLLLQSWIPSAI